MKKNFNTIVKYLIKIFSMGRTKGAKNKLKDSENKKAPKRKSEKPINELIADTFLSDDNSEDSGGSEESAKSIKISNNFTKV